MVVRLQCAAQAACTRCVIDLRPPARQVGRFPPSALERKGRGVATYRFEKRAKRNRGGSSHSTVTKVSAAPGKEGVHDTLQRGRAASMKARERPAAGSELQQARPATCASAARPRWARSARPRMRSVPCERKSVGRETDVNDVEGAPWPRWRRQARATETDLELARADVDESGMGSGGATRREQARRKKCEEVQQAQARKIGPFLRKQLPSVTPQAVLQLCSGAYGPTNPSESSNVSFWKSHSSKPLAFWHPAEQSARERSSVQLWPLRKRHSQLRSLHLPHRKLALTSPASFVSTFPFPLPATPPRLQNAHP